MARDPAVTLERAKARAEAARCRLQEFRDRQALRNLKRAYDAARPNQYHPKRGDKRSPDAVMQHAGSRLREIARYLDENSDIAIAVLDDLTNKSIGTGIGIEPTVRLRSGKLATRANDEIRKALRAWTGEAIDVRRDLPWGELQRAIFRAWLRDGEILIKHVEGISAAINHRGPIPYSLELLEADHLPFEVFSGGAEGNRVVHGVELNGWGQAVAYHLTRSHPGDYGLRSSTLRTDVIRTAAQAITHLKFARRIGQTRGVTVFHGVLTRIQDVKDWDESELVAARVASAFTVAITRNEIYTGSVNVQDGRRAYELAPGMIIDDLMPGESVETISSNRPTTTYDQFRASQQRGIAAGTGASHSSVSRRYDGNYSAQRQEMTESQTAYAALRRYFIARFIREVYRRALDLAELAGVVNLAGVDPATRYNFEAIEPAMPWIDPLKEINADKLAIEAKIRSRHQVIRARGGDPVETDAQIATDELAAGAPPAPPAPPSVPLEDAEDEAIQGAA